MVQNPNVGIIVRQHVILTVLRYEVIEHALTHPLPNGIPVGSVTRRIQNAVQRFEEGKHIGGHIRGSKEIQVDRINIGTLGNGILESSDGGVKLKIYVILGIRLFKIGNRLVHEIDAEAGFPHMDLQIGRSIGAFFRSTGYDSGKAGNTEYDCCNFGKSFCEFHLINSSVL